MTRGDAPSKTSHHTSGPWRASECLTVCQDGGGAIAQCFWVSGAIELEAAEANARLIAAAPDLLEALRGAFMVAGWGERAAMAAEGGEDPEKWDGLVREWSQIARKAIAKAEGRE